MPVLILFCIQFVQLLFPEVLRDPEFPNTQNTHTVDNILMIKAWSVLESLHDPTSCSTMSASICDLEPHLVNLNFAVAILWSCPEIVVLHPYSKMPSSWMQGNQEYLWIWILEHSHAWSGMGFQDLVHSRLSSNVALGLRTSTWSDWPCPGYYA